MKAWLKTHIAFRLLRWALAWLPRNSWQWQMLTTEARARREYERHEGYMLLLGAAPLPFETWRAERTADTRKVTVIYPRPRRRRGRVA